MKLSDIKQKYNESFEVQVKPKQFSYKDLYEELSSSIEEDEEFSEEELKGYIFRNYIYDIIDEPNDLIIKL